ncbi:MAG: adhesin, partial [Haemophilus parainfluenzae]|nr:adhesin [Haemophilus parainfluenzae]
YSLDSNLTNLDKVVVNGKDGANGKDGVTITGPNGAKGEDGKVGITGKDGKDAVSIAGKDGVGHIGLTGPKGADGSDGKSVDISTNDGIQTLVNQEPGTDKSQRIVYTPKDKDGNPIKGKDGKDIVREVATMDDGLKFAGDDGQTDDSKVIAKKLNQKVDIVGGADKTKLTENNIGVNNKDGKLNVQLSKDINLTDAGSIKFGDDLTINNNGLTIKDGPSITKTGIDGGNKQIKNVAEGTEDNDAVTVKQLKDSKTALVNGKNTTVTGTGTKADPYKVNVEGALKDITSITNKDGNGKVEFAADQVVNVAGDNPIKLDAKTGDITGLTNKDLNGPTYAKAGRAATEEQLEAKGTQITNNLTAKGLNFGAQSGDVIHKDLGEKLDIVGEGTKADDRYDATNIKTMTKDGKVVIGLAKDLTADKVTVGQKGEPGKDGVDGQIGVNGKDGSAVVLNGKDGSIGLNGENGKNGVSIKG